MSIKTKGPPPESIKNFLKYLPTDGCFYWIKKRNNRIKLNKRITTKTTDGRIQIMFEGMSYYASRLAWWYEKGSWPKSFIDHINGDRTDDRISNLRDVTMKENNKNKTIHRDTGLFGVSFNKLRKKWSAKVKENGKSIHIGVYHCPYMAAMAVHMYQIGEYKAKKYRGKEEKKYIHNKFEEDHKEYFKHRHISGV